MPGTRPSVEYYGRFWRDHGVPMPPRELWVGLRRRDSSTSPGTTGGAGPTSPRRTCRSFSRIPRRDTACNIPTRQGERPTSGGRNASTGSQDGALRLQLDRRDLWRAWNERSSGGAFPRGTYVRSVREVPAEPGLLLQPVCAMLGCPLVLLHRRRALAVVVQFGHSPACRYPGWCLKGATTLVIATHGRSYLCAGQRPPPPGGFGHGVAQAEVTLPPHPHSPYQGRCSRSPPVMINYSDGGSSSRRSTRPGVPTP